MSFASAMRRACRWGGPSRSSAGNLLFLVFLLCYPGVVHTQQQSRKLQEETKSISGFTYIALKYVPGEMREDIQADYEAVCVNFFGEALAQFDPPILNLEAEMVQQELVYIAEETVEAAGNSRALLRGPSSTIDEDPRALQAIDGNLPALLTMVRVEGEVAQDAEVGGDLNALLLLAMEADSQSFVNDLNALPDASGVYFLSVEDAEAFDPRDFTPFPTLAPSSEIDDDDDDLAVVGIVFAIIGGFLVLGAGLFAGWYFSKQSAAEGAGAAAASAEAADAAGTTPAPAAATRAAVAPTTPTTPTPVGKPIRDDEVSPSADILPAGLIPEGGSLPAGDSSLAENTEGGNVSYTYSLDAGSMDQQSAQGAISTLGGDQSTDVSGRRNMAVSREVIAPPGKLGIVIDTTLEGPIIQKVMPGSPLTGVVSPGDVIVAIDGVDTRAMSGNAITALMFKTANKERRMTILSEEEPDTTAG